MGINWVTTACAEGYCIEIGWVAVDRQFCSGGDCVEIAPAVDDTFLIRSNLHPDAAPTTVTGDELRAFLAAVKAGQFDELAGSR